MSTRAGAGKSAGRDGTARDRTGRDRAAGSRAARDRVVSTTTRRRLLRLRLRQRPRLRVRFQEREPSSKKDLQSKFQAESKCGCSKDRWRQEAILLPPFFYRGQ